MTAAEPRAGGCAGFSLAEVVVALGLLASILISVAGLLVVGSRQVSRGRDSTKALALGREVLEEMKSWSFERMSRALAAVEGCVDAQSCAVDTDDAAAVPEFAQWKQRAESNLGEGVVVIRLDSLDGLAIEQSRALRITVTVEWLDGPAPHSLRLATVRM